jgi:hypothetical protein
MENMAQHDIHTVFGSTWWIGARKLASGGDICNNSASV